MAQSAGGDVWGPDEPGAVNLKDLLQQAGKDGQEDWEYEYSNTENEVGHKASLFVHFHVTIG